jgi:hypothetical protein
MQLFDFFMLIFEHRNTHGLARILVYGIPALYVICLCASIWEHRSCGRRPSEPRMATKIATYRNAVRDFDREVRAWEAALAQLGGRRL